MRRIAALALLLAACGPSHGPPENQASANQKLTADAGSEANRTEANSPAKLPPANAALRFVGRWAASQAECASKPWIFTDKLLSGAGAPKCSFYKVSKAPGGYDIAATCPAEQPVHNDLIRLRFAESAGAMLLESNALPPTGLIYCGE
jgi:hypothetical protein